MKKNKQDIAPIIIDLITKKAAKTQAEICEALNKKGYQVNQVKISRLLHKLGAVKVKNEDGEVTYWLPKEPPPPKLSDITENLIISTALNESLIIIHTTPGAASVVSRALDYAIGEIEILGTVAGDDTIFIAPKSITKIKKVYEEIRGRIWPEE